MKRLAKLRKRYSNVVKRYTVTRIRINSGGYDSSGRYWGIGKPLYEVTEISTGKIVVVRSTSAIAARKEALQLDVKFGGFSHRWSNRG